MGLITSSESDNTASQPEQIKTIEDKVATTKDTFINRTSILPERYTETFGTLLSYASGTPITVEYYSRIFSITDKRTDNIDFSSTRHSTDTDFLLVHDFEFKLEGELEVETDEEMNVTTITGIGVTYPGFEPKLGDLFTYTLPDAQIGIFIVSSSVRLSIQQGTYHKVGFKLYAYADESLLTKMNTSVSEEAYFDKERFLTNDVALISTQDYVYLSDLKKYRTLLIQYYYNTFFVDSYNSFMRPDDIYDPYIVEFMLNKVTYDDTDHRAQQLYPKLKNYDKSIWGLLDSNIHTDMTLLLHSYFILPKVQYTYDTVINQLIDREFILLGDVDDINISEQIYVDIDEVEEIPYIFSTAFYQNDTVTMTALEGLLYQAITTRTVDISSVLDTYISTFQSLSAGDQFNFIPLYIHLIDVAIATIT